MLKRPIIVFDSGIGGLSIYRPLRVRLPSANLVYIADTKNFPYGNKSKAWLHSRFHELGAQFAALNPQLVVLACNTATTNVIKELRAGLPCPIVGVEPVIKPLSNFSSALALMTKSAAQSTTTKELLKKYGTHIRVFSPQSLASAIEYNDYDQVEICIHEIKELAQKYQVQAIGLSCTHYSLILPQLQKALPDVTFIDPSQAVVREIARVLRLTGYEKV